MSRRPAPVDPVAAAEDVAPFPQGYVDRRRFAATWNGALS